jgi:hypothetical protein
MAMGFEPCVSSASAIFVLEPVRSSTNGSTRQSRVEAWLSVHVSPWEEPGADGGRSPSAASRQGISHLFGTSAIRTSQTRENRLERSGTARIDIWWLSAEFDINVTRRPGHCSPTVTLIPARSTFSAPQFCDLRRRGLFRLFRMRCPVVKPRLVFRPR